MAVLHTKDLILRVADTEFASQLLEYYIRNKSFLEAYEPVRDSEFYTYDNQYALLEQEMIEAANNTAFRFYLSEKGDRSKIIGVVGLNNIVWGCFLSCFIGYKLDGEYVNQGYMTQAIHAVVDFAFNDLTLHRIEGNVMPRNTASLRVLEKCGFKNEGLAEKYLKINGVWEDHTHMVRINENL